ncbi:MAG: hypothetical protein F4121_12965 [Acidimicrobiia bacterium]|nr:hypothetical protein [Acidimicrobiia bacterium]
MTGTILTPASARVVDPILTNVLLGYDLSQDYVFPHIFPHVPVRARGGKIIEFDAEQFMEVDLIRAPGADRMRVRFKRSSKSFALEQRAVDGILELENIQESRTIGIDEQAHHAMAAYDLALLQTEIDAATLATTTSNYSTSNVTTLSGTSQWDHASSKPAQTVDDAKVVIKGKIGVYPNTLVVGGDVHLALRTNGDVLDRVKYTGMRRGDVGVNSAALAEYFGVEHYVPAETVKGKIGAFTELWADKAWLGYVPPPAMRNMRKPSFGYTYRLNGYPMASPAWFDRKCDSYIFPVTTEE